MLSVVRMPTAHNWVKAHMILTCIELHWIMNRETSATRGNLVGISLWDSLGCLMGSVQGSYHLSTKKRERSSWRTLLPDNRLVQSWPWPASASILPPWYPRFEKQNQSSTQQIWFRPYSQNLVCVLLLQTLFLVNISLQPVYWSLNMILSVGIQVCFNLTALDLL